MSSTLWPKDKETGELICPACSHGTLKWPDGVVPVPGLLGGLTARRVCSSCEWVLTQVINEHSDQKGWSI